MNIKTIKQIDVSDWDALVTKTYCRPYSFQQQDGCKERQSVGIKYALLEIDRGQKDKAIGALEDKVKRLEEAFGILRLAVEGRQGEASDKLYSNILNSKKE